MVMYMYIDIYIDLLVGIGHLQYLGCTCRLYQKNVVVFFKWKQKTAGVNICAVMSSLKINQTHYRFVLKYVQSPKTILKWLGS